VKPLLFLLLILTAAVHAEASTAQLYEECASVEVKNHNGQALADIETDEFRLYRTAHGFRLREHDERRESSGYDLSQLPPHALSSGCDSRTTTSAKGCETHRNVFMDSPASNGAPHVIAIYAKDYHKLYVTAEQGQNMLANVVLSCHPPEQP